MFKRSALPGNRKRYWMERDAAKGGTMKPIEEIIRSTTEENQNKVDWTKAWGTKYPVLNTYQNEVDIPKYAAEIRRMFTQLQTDHGYSELDAMLVLKDILAHEYMDHRPNKKRGSGKTKRNLK